MLEKLLKTYRVKDWIKNIGICVIGLAAKKVFLNPFLFSIGVLQSAFLFAFLFIFDDYNDSVVEKHEQNRNSKTIFVFLLPLAFSFAFAVVFFSPNYFTIYLLFLFFAITYSIPKVRMDDKPFLDVIWNVIMFSLIFIQAVFFTNSSFSQTALFILIWFVFFTFSLELIHQLVHFSQDTNSTAIFCGKKKTIKIIQISFLVSIFVATVIFIGFPELRIFSATMFTFSLIRFLYSLKFSTRSSFEKLRNQMGGLIEGIIYLIIILLQA